MSKIRVTMVFEYDPPTDPVTVKDAYGTDDVHEMAKQDAQSLENGDWGIMDIVNSSIEVSVKFEGVEEAEEAEEK